MTSAAALIFTGLLLIASVNCEAQEVKPAEQKAVIEFFPIAELSPPDTFAGEVHNAKPATPADWPVSFWAFNAATNSYCSANLVAGRVLMTAAHCVPDKTITFAGKTADCDVADEFDGSEFGRTADYALCYLDTPFRNGPYERVNTASNLLKLKQRLTLLGFGCTDKKGLNDGTLRWGDVYIQALPAGDNNHIDAEGEAAACYGDSGGGSFIFFPNGARVEVAITSKFPGYYEARSYTYLASTSTGPALKLFARAKAKGFFICGVHDEAVGCRKAPS